MHVCHSGCRVLLGMMSTSEPTFSSASASMPSLHSDQLFKIIAYICP